MTLVTVIERDAIKGKWHNVAIHIKKWTSFVLCLCGAIQRGDTPLYWAARHGHLEAVKYLCSKEADINVQDVVSDGINLLSWHIDCGFFLQIVRF